VPIEQLASYVSEVGNRATTRGWSTRRPGFLMRGSGAAEARSP